MLLTAVFNSCINPVIYGAHYLPAFRTLGRSREDRWVGGACAARVRVQMGCISNNNKSG